jgi:Ser/Thr protein kinase RdoA (MazF antagonist)
VEVLRPAALEAARRFGLEVVRCELAAHAFNTTFKLETTAGTSYALRVGTNSHSTRSNVVAQQSWQQAIAANTDVPVPEPLATPDGHWFVQVDSDVVGRPLLITAASWLDGPDLEELDAAASRELGRTMALLHQHARDWTLPPGASLPRFDTPLFGDEDLLVGSASGLQPEERAVLQRAREVTAEAFAAVYEDVPVQPLHADLHGGNLKRVDGRIAVFDFDDSGLGVPALDLAITTFYLRSGDPAPERALLAGYTEVAPLPEVEPHHFEAMIAARQLLLANSLLASTTSDLRAESQRYLHTTCDRLRTWLEIGRFTRAAAGA